MNYVHSQTIYVSHIFLTTDNTCVTTEYSSIGPSNRITMFPMRYEMNLHIKFRSVLIAKGLKMLSMSEKVCVCVCVCVHIYHPIIGRRINNITKSI